MGEAILVKYGGASERNPLDDIVGSSDYCAILAHVMDSGGNGIPNIPINCNDGGRWYNYTTNENGYALFMTNSGRANIITYNWSVLDSYNMIDQTAPPMMNIDAPVGVKKLANFQFTRISGTIQLTTRSNLRFMDTKELKHVYMTGGGGGASAYCGGGGATNAYPGVGGGFGSFKGGDGGSNMSNGNPSAYANASFNYGGGGAGRPIYSGIAITYGGLNVYSSRNANNTNREQVRNWTVTTPTYGFNGGGGDVRYKNNYHTSRVFWVRNQSSYELLSNDIKNTLIPTIDLNLDKNGSNGSGGGASSLNDSEYGRGGRGLLFIEI